MSVEIDTERFHLRELDLDDATPRYLGWFSDPAIARYISGAAGDLSDLRSYIGMRRGRADVLFLGIFDRAEGRHIGNIKFEPVDSERGYAIMGLLIGDAGYRGRGVAAEVLNGAGRWLHVQRRINQIVLGVHAENTAALMAYEKAGFVVEDSPLLPGRPAESITMVWHL